MYLENAFHENVDKVFLNEEVNAKLTTHDVIHPRITDLERICYKNEIKSKLTNLEQFLGVISLKACDEQPYHFPWGFLGKNIILNHPADTFLHMIRDGW